VRALHGEDDEGECPTRWVDRMGDSRALRRTGLPGCVEPGAEDVLNGE
jgi:hypothetical protein